MTEVAHLLGLSVPRLRREVERGDHDALKVRHGWRFTWRQAALLALQCWTLAEVFDALGADAADNGTTLDHLLYGELIDFAGALPLKVARRIPGYRQAYLYPGEE